MKNCVSLWLGFLPLKLLKQFSKAMLSYNL